MSEKKYEVRDRRGNVIATNMTLDYALLFMKAVCEEYYCERMSLTLSELEGCKEACGDD